MHRLSIQQFRAALASRSTSGTLVSAYRALTCRPELAAGAVHGDWGTWTGAPTAGVQVRAYRALARRPELAAGIVHRDWGVWAGAPAA